LHKYSTKVRVPLTPVLYGRYILPIIAGNCYELITLKLSSIMAFLQSDLPAEINLSPQELFDISLAISRQFSPRFFARPAAAKASLYSQQELLSISQEISRDFFPHLVATEAMVMVLPVDPQRLHVYWRLGEAAWGPNSKPLADHKLILRVFSSADDLSAQVDTKSQHPWIDFEIENTRHAFEVNLPAEISGFNRTGNAVVSESKIGEGNQALLKTGETLSTKPVPEVEKLTELNNTPASAVAEVFDLSGENKIVLPAHASYRAAIGFEQEDHTFMPYAYSNAADLPNPRLALHTSGFSVALSQLIAPARTDSSPAGNPLTTMEKN